MDGNQRLGQNNDEKSKFPLTSFNDKSIFKSLVRTCLQSTLELDLARRGIYERVCSQGYNMKAPWGKYPFGAFLFRLFFLPCFIKLN